MAGRLFHRYMLRKLLMRNRYDISGYFYTLTGRKCRKYLDIKLKTSISKKPDLMVVMMNPGSSYPVNRIDDFCKPTSTVPDKTQDQIMKVMGNCSFEYARILNLSDIRTPKSNDLYQFLKSRESISFPHSIFSPERAKDFNELFSKDVPVIYGWGVNKALTELSELAAKTIKYGNSVGLKKIRTKHAYYHPLPRSHKKQEEWVSEISKTLRRT